MNTKLQDEERDLLVAELWRHGVRFLGPTPADQRRFGRIPTSDFIERIAKHPSSRLRLSLIPFLILHPERSNEVAVAASRSEAVAKVELQALYTAAVYLQRFWHTRLQLYLGDFELLPDLYSKHLALPSPDEQHGKIGLRALSEQRSGLSGYCFNRLASFNKMMDLLFEQLEAEEKQRESASTR